MSNLDKKTVKSFGAEWSHFRQDIVDRAELEEWFNRYFSIFPWKSLPDDAEGFDMGCGSGRWARFVAPRVEKLNCIDPSPDALSVARQNLSSHRNIYFFNESVSDTSLPPNSQDFGYSLGVLHHVPDTKSAISQCVGLLRPGAPFLIYLYYRFDNKPSWYTWLWRLSNLLRVSIAKAPERVKRIITDLLAACVYFPFSRIAKGAEKLGLEVKNWPLSSYRHSSFYTLRTDSRDRFGTPLEQRFTKSEIQKMMEESGLENIRFSSNYPYWCALGFKKIGR